MILHCVYLRLKNDAEQTDLLEIMQGLELVCANIDGCAGFEHGPNRDFEDKTPDYPYGFVVRFWSRESLEAYAQNMMHKELGARLVELCHDGADGISVYDLEVAA